VIRPNARDLTVFALWSPTKAEEFASPTLALFALGLDMPRRGLALAELRTVNSIDRPTPLSLGSDALWMFGVLT
jgi:hypothetical protein